MASVDEFLRRQRALAEFGEFVLGHDDLDGLMTECCRLVAGALGADLAKVIEIDRASNTGLVRAGYGWNPGVVGRSRVGLSDRSCEAYAIARSEPIVTRDMRHEDRFEFPDFLREHGVVAIVNVPIFLPGRRPFGVLQVDARTPRDFGDDEIQFLKTYAMTLGPVIDRLQTVAALEETDERLHLIVENARGYAIVLSDPDDRITHWLAGSETIFGWTAAEIVGQPAAVLFTQEDRAEGVPDQELALARCEGTAPNVRWHVRKDGQRVFVDGQTVALKGADERLRGYLKIGQDVTDRKRHEERQAVLLAELQHRVRNVLAMVRSLVRRTARSGETAEAFGSQLEGRIDALARTQAVLTREVGAGVDLERVVREELSAHAVEDEAVHVSGPTIKLAPKAAELVSLAVHELATNASKYGAFAHPGGSLDIRWDIQAREGGQWLSFSWRERGLNLDAVGPRRMGFGTELITRHVPYELNGRGELRHEEQGVRCLIEFPLVNRDSPLDPMSPP